MPSNLNFIDQFRSTAIAQQPQLLMNADRRGNAIGDKDDAELEPEDDEKVTSAVPITRSQEWVEKKRM